MNYALVDNAADLLTWPALTGRDTYGIYHIITGYEGTGKCFWCGDELAGKRRRFCGGCLTQYEKHFYWPYARSWCIKRADHKCENCGEEEKTIGYYLQSSLEAHHIISLNGEQRAATPYNIPWNLICFCHYCHLEVGAAMRPPKWGKAGRIEVALSRGSTCIREPEQMVMSL